MSRLLPNCTNFPFKFGRLPCRRDCGPMAWLPWKGKKKVLETKKSREMQDSSTLKKAAPAKEPETAPSKPDAAEESAVDCCAICLTGLEPTERAFVFEGCRCRSCICAACRFANDAHARTHSHTHARAHTHHKTQTQTNKNTHTHMAGMSSTASALARG